VRITPLDIQKHDFPVKFRGFDTDEVRSFLQLVAEAFEGVIKEAAGHKTRVTQLEDDLAGYREREKILKNTLLSAQKMSDDMKENARKEADLMIKEAEIKADRLVSQAQVRATKFENAISELKLMKAQLRQKLQATVEMVEHVTRLQEEEDAADDKLRFAKRRDEV